MRFGAVVLSASCMGACSLLVDTEGYIGAGASKTADAGGLDATSPVIVVPSAFGHRKAIRIDHAQVAADLQGFPVALVIDADERLRTVSSGGAVESASGYDITFGDATGQVAYPHELERYEGSIGALVAWVRVPLLSAATDTTFYVYYGSAGVTAPTERPVDVWDPSYVGVWHLDEPSGPRRDSTRNHLDLEERLATIRGGTDTILGGAAEIVNEKQDGLVITDTAQSALDLTGPMTVTLWLKATSSFSQWRNVVTRWGDKADDPSPSNAYYIGEDSTPGGYRVKFSLEDATGKTVIYGRTVMQVGAWQHVAAVYDGQTMQVYVDGAPDATPVARTTGARSVSTAFDVGNKTVNPAFGHDGPLDELHVANVARSPAWLRTEFANQSSPTTFAKIGAEETL